MANPITVAEAQSHLRLGTLDADETLDLELMITTATEYASDFCNRPFYNKTVTVYCDSFPVSARGSLVVHTTPDTDPTVTYYDTDHTLQTLTSVRTVTIGGRTTLYPAFGASWPADCCNEPSNISIVSDTDTSAIPSAVKSAVLLLVGDLYENRENSVVGSGLVSTPVVLTAEKLLYPYKTRIA